MKNIQGELGSSAPMQPPESELPERESAATTSRLSGRRSDEIGLALSGGGFRATLFALGTLWRLNDCGWLRKLTHVTSVSGGSITAAYLGLQWRNLQFDSSGVASNFDALIARPLESFCSRRVDVPCGIKGLITPWRTIGEFVASTYRAKLYGTSTLQDLPAEGQGPIFILYATNLQTGVSVRFAHDSISDYRLGRINHPQTPLSTVVAASSAFPPFLSPIRLKTDLSCWRQKTALDDALRSKMILTDGGVYDNMGLEAIFERCGTVLVSDAGAPADIVAAPWLNWFGQLARVRAIMMEQTRALRRRMVMANLKMGNCNGALWRVGSRIGNFKVPSAMATDTETTRALQYLRTRLNPFTVRERGELINWGYVLCDAAMRTHVDPSIPIGFWPRPEFKFRS